MAAPFAGARRSHPTRYLTAPILRLSAMRWSRTPGKKSCEHFHFDPQDPPRCRANKKRGRGTSANDRPPILCTVGRVSGQGRLQVVTETKQTTLRTHVEQLT